MSAPMTSYRRSTAVLLLLALAVLAPRGVLAANNSKRKFDRALLAAVESNPPTPQPVIIRARAGQLAAVRNWLKAKKVAVESEQPALNALSTNLNATNLSQIADLVETETLSLNAPVTGFGGPKNNAPAPAAPPPATILRATLGLTPASPTGKGIGIAIIDTGV